MQRLLGRINVMTIALLAIAQSASAWPGAFQTIDGDAIELLDRMPADLVNQQLSRHHVAVNWEAGCDEFVVAVDGEPITDLRNARDDHGNPVFAGSRSDGVMLRGSAEVDANGTLVLIIDVSDDYPARLTFGAEETTTAWCSCIGTLGPATLKCTPAHCNLNTVCAGTVQAPTGHCTWTSTPGEGL